MIAARTEASALRISVRSTVLLGLVLCAGSTGDALAGSRFGPFGSTGFPVTREVPAQALHAPPPIESGFLELGFRFYALAISPIDGPTCLHHPTCSLYARQAIRRHGVVGLWLTLDRLLRGVDSSAVRRLPLVRVDDVYRFEDPVSESAFWFSSVP